MSEPSGSLLSRPSQPTAPHSSLPKKSGGSSSSHRPTLKSFPPPVPVSSSSFPLALAASVAGLAAARLAHDCEHRALAAGLAHWRRTS
ncbi:hypothetical protein GUJ93_ZPchr0002g24000 [Zizania palustris]|uniref:Uncharacterized protein n=1 Tax=Zizania palustris TaxID=103762 RepID=A0A8J5RSE0_ZIZPA|nr:hypothetical protein GUJ93_ZPchr0002g24000 [Zizania palustris]